MIPTHTRRTFYEHASTIKKTSSSKAKTPQNCIPGVQDGEQGFHYSSKPVFFEKIKNLTQKFFKK